jgi:hypothetical protein
MLPSASPTGEDAPDERVIEPPSAPGVNANDVLGGLHRRYYRPAA